MQISRNTSSFRPSNFGNQLRQEITSSSSEYSTAEIQSEERKSESLSEPISGISPRTLETLKDRINNFGESVSEKCK